MLESKEKSAQVCQRAKTGQSREKHRTLITSKEWKPW